MSFLNIVNKKHIYLTETLSDVHGTLGFRVTGVQKTSVKTKSYFFILLRDLNKNIEINSWRVKKKRRKKQFYKIHNT